MNSSAKCPDTYPELALKLVLLHTIYFKKLLKLTVKMTVNGY